ncbi:MAG: hypothetical protein L7F77_03850 [Candidatus Magnetominusculus sp. LBB02]|nr:hypothetical protein [Candidatus Magnetominusculus sp. LBB02]
MCDKTDYKAIDKAINMAMDSDKAIINKTMDIEASQCVCDMEWRAIKVGDDSDDCRCLF